MYYPFYGSNDQDNEINEMEKMFAYAQESSGLQTSNLLTVGYFTFPHLPYIVDENGNKTNNVDRSNLSDPVPYLGQFKYANKKILEMVKVILENDPDSIIILQSDHGYRLPTHLSYWYGIQQYDLKTEAPFEQNILDAVYYRGQPVDIEGLSGLNTLKVVLNQLLDAGLVITK
jgi:phosphoglycerol transferase MdoB-like AlkP superfamily enzyme